MDDGNNSTWADRLLFRPSEVAVRLALSRSRVYELIASGEIASISIGGVRRVPEPVLSDLIRRLAEEQGAAGGHQR